MEQREPYYASSPCPLGSLRAELERHARLGESLGPQLKAAVPLPRSRQCRQPPRPLAGGQCRALPSPRTARGPSARAKVAEESGWPAELVALAGLGVRGLVPRGTFFQRYMTCPVEPKRNGTYQFCVVGLDAAPGQPRYLAWEPTGYFDRFFACEEVELRLALQRAGQAGSGTVVSWPDAADVQQSLVYTGRLPELDARTGLPAITPSCKHQPRTSIDLLGPMLHEWQKRFLPSLRLRAAGAPLRVLVFDHSGRLAKHLQDSLEDVVVVAAEGAALPRRRSLGTLRDKTRHPVGGALLKGAPPALKVEDKQFDVVVVPFALQRLCHGAENELLTLWREALRCCTGHLLLAEERNKDLGDWKAVLQGDWSAVILQEGALPSSEVRDHFLSTSDIAERRFLVVDASTFQDRREARGGQIPTVRRALSKQLRRSQTHS
ncbi:unnamed protein product [Effrenium voratum]|nr:unnamed protein product [Effrenium voratum]